MPTFRDDPKLGCMVPMMKTNDINDQAITKDKIRDGNVTTEKLANGAVSTDKLPDGAIKASKIANENITTEKLAEGAVETSKIADQNVTSEKIADQSVDNSKLSPEAVTYDKVKDKAIITEKLNDRAVTTEKVEERAITNPKLGNQSVDGRVVREASLESKHFAKESVTTEKIKDSSVTNEKVADDTLGIEKFDPELRKTIQAATGLPEDLSQMIQNVDLSIKQLKENDTDLQSQVNNNQQKITANKSAQDAKNASLDKNMAKLNTRDDQITEILKNITITGGASVASAVTYDNTTSQLTSANIQGAVDELQGAKIDKTSILQESGEAEDKVMSQKAVSDKLTNLFLDEKVIAQSLGELNSKVEEVDEKSREFQSDEKVIAQSLGELGTKFNTFEKRDEYVISQSISANNQAIRNIKGRISISVNSYNSMLHPIERIASCAISENEIPFAKMGEMYYGIGASGIGSKIMSCSQFYSGGTAQADMRAVMYEDGSPYIENNKMYFSCTLRTSSTGIGIYEMSLGTGEMKLVGTILNKQNGKYVLGSAPHIMFNREEGVWQLTTLNGKYAIYYNDIRFGVTHGELNTMEGWTEEDLGGLEDPSVYKIDEKWYLVYAISSPFDESVDGYIVYREGTDAHTLTTTKKYIPVKGTTTGLSVTKIGGKYYVLTGQGLKAVDDNLVYYDFPQLTNRGTVNIDIKSGGWRGWGTIVPIPDGSKTKYIYRNFDRLESSDETQWTYGSLYLYQALEENEGLEFSTELNGKPHPATIRSDNATYSISDLHFKRVSVERRNMCDRINLSAINLDTDTLAQPSKSNMYPKIGNAGLAYGKYYYKLSTNGTAILLGTMHQPFCCYEIDACEMQEGEVRFLYLGNTSGTSICKVVVRRQQNNLYVDFNTGNNTVNIGMMSYENCKLIVSLRKSDMQTKDGNLCHLYVYKINNFLK